MTKRQRKEPWPPPKYVFYSRIWHARYMGITDAARLTDRELRKRMRKVQNG